MPGPGTLPLAVTMGDPKGIGIEITAKSWQQRKAGQFAPFFLIGPLRTIETQIINLKLDVPVQAISSPAEASSIFERSLPVLSLDDELSSAKATLLSIELGTQLCLEGKAAGIVTNPIHKKRLYDTGFRHAGHTEFLAELTGCAGKSVMMLACAELKVVPATIHIPLKDVPEHLTRSLLEHVISVTHADLKTRFGLPKPRITVAGLNPHAGENGSIGEEEISVIIPTLKQLQIHGMDITGPYPADSLFHKAARDHYDAVICMYHDQALIPLKTIDFDGGVNVTLGLPIIRTSPDHGTADDIAGKGIANPSSLIAALKMATDMSTQTDG